MMGGVATTLREDTILERVLLYRRRKRVLRLIFFFFFKSISFSVSSILFSCCFEGKIECRDEGRIEN